MEGRNGGRCVEEMWTDSPLQLTSIAAHIYGILILLLISLVIVSLYTVCFILLKATAVLPFVCITFQSCPRFGVESAVVLRMARSDSLLSSLVSVKMAQPDFPSTSMAVTLAVPPVGLNDQSMSPNGSVLRGHV